MEVEFHVTDRAAFRPLRTGIAFLLAARRQAPSELEWRSEAYEFVASTPAIDLLAGTDELRLGVEAGASLAELTAPFAPFQREFVDRVRPLLLYS